MARSPRISPHQAPQSCLERFLRPGAVVCEQCHIGLAEFGSSGMPANSAAARSPDCTPASAWPSSAASIVYPAGLRSAARPQQRTTTRFHQIARGFASGHPRQPGVRAPPHKPLPAPLAVGRSHSPRSPGSRCRRSFATSAPSAGVMTPSATADVTAAIAVAMSAASAIGGKSRCTGRVRRGAMIRSKQSRIAVGSPSRANSMTFGSPPRPRRRAKFRRCGQRGSGTPRLAGRVAGLSLDELALRGCGRPEFAG